MSAKKPELRLPLSAFWIPTLEVMSKALARDFRGKYHEFATEYSEILSKHLSTETEVTIVNGNLSEDCAATLHQLELEFDALQYKTQIQTLAAPWKSKLYGQPNLPGFSKVLDETVDKLIHEFEIFIFKLQNAATMDRRERNKQLLTKAISCRSMILNLSDSEIPPELEKMLNCGANFVPMIELSQKELTGYIENDLKNAAINFYRDVNKVYPLVQHSAGLKTVLKQLMSQSPSNSYQLEFYTNMYENYVVCKEQFYEQLSKGHFIESIEKYKLAPAGTILTLSDKGLGPCLLPVEWFVMQYQIQAEKGKHEPTGLSPDQCINLLKLTIQNFRNSLKSQESMCKV